MFTFLIVLFKNVTQKETSDGLINGGISCDFVTLKENLGRSVHLFFALYWCFCVSIIPITLLLFHNSDGITGLFFPLNIVPYTNNPRDG